MLKNGVEKKTPDNPKAYELRLFEGFKDLQERLTILKTTIKGDLTWNLYQKI
jgi:hypothetical protein